MIEPAKLFRNGPVKLSRSQTKVLNFLCQYPEKAMFMTAAQIAQALGLADSTVVRLAYPLGFSNFMEMKRFLQDEFRNHWDTISRLEPVIKGISSVGDVLEAILLADQDNLARTRESVSREEFGRVVKILNEAPEVHILGLRSAFAVAHFLGNALEFLGRRVQVLMPGLRDIWSRVSLLGPGSVLVAISLPRYTRLTVAAAEAAHQSGATVIALTDSAVSPLARSADHVLTAYYRIDSFIESYVASLSLVNALVTGVAFLDGPKTLERLRRLERVWKERNVYHPLAESPWPSWAEEVEAGSDL